MRLRLPHAPYVANKIAIDLLKSGYVTLNKGIEPVIEVAKKRIEEDIKREMALDEKVELLLEENIDEIEFMQIDRRNMFWLIKKKIAGDEGFVLSYEDRFSELSHQILDELWNEDLIDYTVSENRIKNKIYSSIEEYINSFEEIQDRVVEQIDNYKRKIIPGSEEYDLIFEQLYEKELQKRGMLR